MTFPTRVLELGGQALRALLEVPPESSRERLGRELRRSGCPSEEAASVLEALHAAGLLRVVESSGALVLTEAGRRAGDSLARGDWSQYASRLLALPWIQEQFEDSLQLVQRLEGGAAFDVRAVGRIAPELAAVASWLPRHPDAQGVVLLPDEWLESLHFERPQPGPAQRASVREAVGARAELYSLHFERARKAPSKILWISRESDRYGYDIEDRTLDPPCAIEVKGSTERVLRFYMSEHERRVADRLQERYVVHYWAGIELSVSPKLDYRRLRTAGYPLELRNPALMIGEGLLAAVPDSWLVTSGAQEGANSVELPVPAPSGAGDPSGL